MGSPAEDLLLVLQEQDATVATAESLTGGKLAARITAVPGASTSFAGGVVSYMTDIKKRVLDVPEEIVTQHGVVSAECAVAMAEGVRRLLGTTYGVSTTGVAGPEPQEDKPVGTVFIAVAGPDRSVAYELALPGDRFMIQESTVDRAVSVLREIIGSAGRQPEEPALG
ncbi:MULTISPECIES: CinA family protein [Nocardioides]|uniref:CinA family protein n=1 Tax=Nocardioides vastitatis TaxID=2568655 RepID=A0ABW0ZGY9_9ACTN|nr:CinA family protein [Nocardioides sp.]THI96491.1 CinA family protein [Nocardioides sp.]